MNAIYVLILTAYRSRPVKLLLHHLPWRKRCSCRQGGRNCSDYMLASARAGAGLAVILAQAGLLSTGPADEDRRRRAFLATLIAIPITLAIGGCKAGSNEDEGPANGGDPDGPR